MPKRRRARITLPDWLMIPLMLIMIVLLFPFLLIGLFLEERLRRCPACGWRGRLEDVTPPPPPDDWPDDPWLVRRRMVRTREFTCRHCGAHFVQPPDRPLQRVQTPG